MHVRDLSNASTRKAPFKCTVSQFTNIISLSSHLSVFSLCSQDVMPLSSAIFKSEQRNPVPQCPPRLDVQTIVAVLWSRMPNIFLSVETARVSERHGWVVQCLEPLQMIAVHIPEESRSAKDVIIIT